MTSPYLPVHSQCLYRLAIANWVLYTEVVTSPIDLTLNTIIHGAMAYLGAAHSLSAMLRAMYCRARSREEKAHLSERAN